MATPKEQHAALRGVIMEAVRCMLKYPHAVASERQRCLHMIQVAVEAMDTIDSKEAPRAALPEETMVEAVAGCISRHLTMPLRQSDLLDAAREIVRKFPSYHNR